MKMQIQRQFQLKVTLSKPIDQLGEKILQRAYEMDGMMCMGIDQTLFSVVEVPCNFEHIKRPEITGYTPNPTTLGFIQYGAYRDHLEHVASEVQKVRDSGAYVFVDLRLPEHLARAIKEDPSLVDIALTNYFVTSTAIKGSVESFEGPANAGMSEWINDKQDDSVFWPSLDPKAREIKEKFPHYHKKVKGLEYLDVYRVLKLFNVSDPCLQHAIKKLLVAGGRGAKDIHKDIAEAVATLQRWEDMRDEENPF